MSVIVLEGSQVSHISTGGYEIKMKIESIIEKDGLSYWIAFLGWQGGTIHQVKRELLKRLSKKGIFEHKETGELCQMNIDKLYYDNMN